METRSQGRQRTLSENCHRGQEELWSQPFVFVNPPELQGRRVNLGFASHHLRAGFVSEYKDSAALRCWWCSEPKRGFWVTCLSVVTCPNITAEELEGILAPGPTTFIHAWPWKSPPLIIPASALWLLCDVFSRVVQCFGSFRHIRGRPKLPRRST